MSCSSLKSAIVPDAALNNTNYGISNGTYFDPFEGCAELLAISAALNMNVKEFLLHQNQVKRDRITRRAAVLVCLKTINDKRIKDREEGERRKLNDGEDNNVVDGVGGGEPVHVWEQELDGVRAEERLNPDCLREMIMFL